jgi:class 3 adenylate cyclase/pimeloyl-ACP methyl ester carboxylesterase
MEPVVRFCTSADGARIAYATYGSGPPLLFVNTYVLSVDAQFRWPEARAFFDALAARTTLVIIERRGTGASARDVEDLSLDAEVRDVIAVADAAGLDACPVFGDAAGGAAVGARFAAVQPDRVQRLLLWAPSSNTSFGERGAVWQRAFREDWSYARRIWAGMIFPDGPVSLQRAASQALKASLSQEMNSRRMEAHDQLDLKQLLPAVKQPALVLQRERGEGREFAIEVAGLLPNGELRFVPGFGPCAYPNHAAIVDATFNFIGVGEDSNVPAQAAPSGTAIILFLDIAGSTELTTKLGDTVYREKERGLDASLRTAIRDAGGSPVDGKVLGDGVMATFASAKDAIDAAMRCQALGGDAGLSLHAGIHAGDVIRERTNVHGGAVQVASRIADASAAGEVLVSDIVRGLARTSAGVSFEDRGERELKGVSEPVRVFAVRAS